MRKRKNVKPATKNKTILFSKSNFALMTILTVIFIFLRFSINNNDQIPIIFLVICYVCLISFNIFEKGFSYIGSINRNALTLIKNKIVLFVISTLICVFVFYVSFYKSNLKEILLLSVIINSYLFLIFNVQFQPKSWSKKHTPQSMHLHIYLRGIFWSKLDFYTKVSYNITNWIKNDCIFKFNSTLKSRLKLLFKK